MRRGIFFRRNTGGTATAFFDNVRFVAKPVEKTTIIPPPQVPMDFALDQNYPNPFNPATVISFSLPRQVQATLRVYDLLGREVATLADGLYPAGTYQIRFDANSTRSLASGVYLYRLEAGDFVQTRRMLIIR